MRLQSVELAATIASYQNVTGLLAPPSAQAQTEELRATMAEMKALLGASPASRGGPPRKVTALEGEEEQDDGGLAGGTLPPQMRDRIPFDDERPPSKP